jgi:hypothetical protein
MVKPLLFFFFILALCILLGCTQNNNPVNSIPSLTHDIPLTIQQDEAIAIALNDSEVRDYLQKGYVIKNVGPLCYEQSLADRKIYKSCSTGVEIETDDVYLIAYIDAEKHIVNRTSTIYIRSPAIVGLVINGH